MKLNDYNATAMEHAVSDAQWIGSWLERATNHLVGETRRLERYRELPEDRLKLLESRVRMLQIMYRENQNLMEKLK